MTGEPSGDADGEAWRLLCHLYRRPTDVRVGDAIRAVESLRREGVAAPCDAAAGAAKADGPSSWKQRYEEEAAAHRLAHAQWLEVRAERDALRGAASADAMRQGFIEELRKVANGSVPPRVVDASTASDLLTVLAAVQTQQGGEDEPNDPGSRTGWYRRVQRDDGTD